MHIAVQRSDRKRQRMLKCQLLAMRPEGANYLWRKMLLGCGEDSRLGRFVVNAILMFVLWRTTVGLAS
jgi:hypothetical protein